MVKNHADFHPLKTRIVIVPFGTPPKSAEFLKRYYGLARRNRRILNRFVDPIIAGAFLLWCPFRSLSIALSNNKGFGWALYASRYAIKNFVDPLEVLLFDLKGSDSKRYMRRFELAGVMKSINSAGWRATCRLNDKRVFYDYCKTHSLPAPRIYATINQGAISVSGPAPKTDLVIKPARGRGGAGVRIARFLDGEFALTDGDKTMSFADLLEGLSTDKKSETIVCERIVNHPDLQGLAIDGLSTLRLTTCINESGKSELVTSVLRMPAETGVPIDNIKRGGLIAPVNPETGRLGAAKKGKRLGSWIRHPVSGADIEDLQLPCWREAKELVLNAHDAVFADYTVIGWDIAITANGPYIIEGNSKPCVIIAQRGPDAGLGDQRFGNLIAYHLERIASSPVSDFA